MQQANCIFCKIVRGESPSWKVYENEYVYAFLDINPVADFHTLIIPKNHYRDIFETPEFDLREIMGVIKKLTSYYHDELGIQNLQIVNSNGAGGQQDVFHIHYHIVPRKSGDGQNIRWTTYPERRSQFDAQLKRLGNIQ